MIRDPKEIAIEVVNKLRKSPSGGGDLTKDDIRAVEFISQAIRDDRFRSASEMRVAIACVERGELINPENSRIMAGPASD